MKESRMNVKGMWWDGEYGGVVKNGEFKLLTRRPHLDFLPSIWSAVRCDVTLGVNAANNYTQLNTVLPLSADHITQIEVIVDAAFPSAGGGGGGGAGVTDIWAHATLPQIHFRNADGSVGAANIATGVQHTPAYVLLCNMQGNSQLMARNSAVTQGVPVTGLGGTGTKLHRIYAPATVFDKGGVQKGGEYERGQNAFKVDADHVEITFQVNWAVGFHPSWPKYAKGVPLGRIAGGYVIELWNPDTKTWDDVHSWSYTFRNQTTHPNTIPPGFGTAAASVKYSAPVAGTYRLGYFMSEVGNATADDLTYLRMFAYPEGIQAPPSHYWQLSGSIKDTTPSTPILP